MTVETFKSLIWKRTVAHRNGKMWVRMHAWEIQVISPLGRGFKSLQAHQNVYFSGML